MITGFLLSAVYAIMFGLFSNLPNGGSMPSSVISAAQSLGTTLYSWNSLLPISDLLIVIGLTVTLLLGVFAIRCVFFVMALFRGSSMPGSSQ